MGKQWETSSFLLPCFFRGIQKLDFHIPNNYCVSTCWNQIRKSTDIPLNWNEITWGEKKPVKIPASGRIRTLLGN